MKVLMLGWEYPPHIVGGLGTACEGLTTALAKKDIDIQFVVPHLFGGEQAEHMMLLDSRDSSEVLTYKNSQGSSKRIKKTVTEKSTALVTHRVPSFLLPYLSPGTFKERMTQFTEKTMSLMRFRKQKEPWHDALINGEVFGIDLSSLENFWEIELPFPESGRHGDMFSEVERFTANVVALMSQQDFDVIHAHDWMTFPAGVALAQITKKPLIVHIHSLEYDRSGLAVNEQINHIEHFGLEAADSVIAVSHYTQRGIERFHGIPSGKIRVVHNGIYPKQAVTNYKMHRTWPRNVVLFLGRVTFQKGPDYFIEVASRVIQHVPDVLFVLAGNGDMLDRLIHRVKELGLENSFLFPGFLKGEDVEEMFSIADLYVMPSVSEPFGISALEAINFNTPVIISKQSGVSEVLGHALRADFWDLDRMADLIINALLHQELREDMIVMAREELRRLHWDAAAEKTVEVYEELVF